MINRITSAVSKIIFCLQTAHDVRTFFKLLQHTKHFSIFKKQHSYAAEKNEEPVCYAFHLQQQKWKIYLRTFAGDIAVFYEVFWLQVYNIPELQYTSFKTIVDVGANIGLATLYFKSVSPNATVVAIEPDAENFAVMQQNVIGNNVEKVHLLQAAIDSKEGQLQVVKANLAYNSSVSNDKSGYTVPAVSVTNIIEKYNLQQIDLIKIDVEGFESEIFSQHINWLDSVSNVIIEIHSAQDYKVCATALQQKGFTVKRLPPVSAGIEHIYWAYKQ